MGHRLAQLVELASHVQQLCCHCSRPGFDSQPASLPLSQPVSCHIFSCPVNKAKRPKKYTKKKKNK